MEKLEGIADIRTDIKKTEASFQWPKDSDVDLKAKLDEFEQTNEHMADWSYIQAPSGAEGAEGAEGEGEVDVDVKVNPDAGIDLDPTTDDDIDVDIDTDGDAK